VEVGNDRAELYHLTRLVPHLPWIEGLKEHLYTTAVHRGLNSWQAPANPGKNTCV
jgi:hypothetical protein